MPTILVADDEKDIVDLVAYNLQKEGYDVITAENGAKAIEQLPRRPDLVILDVMMPGVNGWEVAKKIKNDRATRHIPVIFLTAKSSEVDEVVGLELGADDYIVKPISVPKLLARIRTVLRKHTAAPATGENLVVGMLSIDPGRHIVTVNGDETFFPKKEFEVLQFLAEREGQAISRETLLRQVWGTDVHVFDRTVDVHIAKIREKLGPCSSYIETIKGVGYRLRDSA
jgi:two-component system alkaline phosphatase synthesis response regulator PhoP